MSSSSATLIITYNKTMLLIDRVFSEGSIRSSTAILVIKSELNCWQIALLYNSVILFNKISMGANTKRAMYERTLAFLSSV